MYCGKFATKAQRRKVLLRDSLRLGAFVATLLVISSLPSCEEPINKPYQNEAPMKLVVDAIITNQPGESYVKLSLPLANPNEPMQMVSGALIYVSDGVNTEIIGEDPLEPGIYRPDAGSRGVSGKIYGIFIQAGEYTDSAYTYLMAVTPLDEFTTRADDSRPGYFFISGDENSDPAMIRYTIIPPKCNGDEDCISEVYEYILSSFDIPQIFSPQKESLSFPSGSKVIRKKYSLNPEYEAYLRAILSETEWRGGLFDVQPGNPKGNFGPNTLGYFAGCSMVVDTVYIK